VEGAGLTRSLWAAAGVAVMAVGGRINYSTVWYVGQ